MELLFAELEAAARWPFPARRGQPGVGPWVAGDRAELLMRRGRRPGGRLRRASGSAAAVTLGRWWISPGAKKPFPAGLTVK